MFTGTLSSPCLVRACITKHLCFAVMLADVYNYYCVQSVSYTEKCDTGIDDEVLACDFITGELQILSILRWLYIIHYTERVNFVMILYVCVAKLNFLGKE